MFMNRMVHGFLHLLATSAALIAPLPRIDSMRLPGQRPPQKSFGRMRRRFGWTTKVQKPRPTPEQIARRAAINSLTNYERTQWARAGYPGATDKGKCSGRIEDVLSFKGIRERNLPRDRAAVAHQVHTLGVGGSNPSPATTSIGAAA